MYLEIRDSESSVSVFIVQDYFNYPGAFMFLYESRVSFVVDVAAVVLFIFNFCKE